MKTFLRGLAAPFIALLALSIAVPAYAQVIVPTYTEAATGNVKQGIGVTSLGMDGVAATSTNVVSTSGATLSAGVLNFTANSQFAVIDVTGYRSVSVLPSGTFTAGYQFQWSNTSTGAWTAGAATDPGNVGLSSDSIGPFTSNVNLLNMNVQAKYLRILITNYTSGTVQLTPVLNSGNLPVRSVLATVAGQTAVGSSPTGNPVQIGGVSSSSSNTVRYATDNGGNFPVTGSVASGVSDSGAPVKTGCVVNNTLPTFTNSQRADCQASPKGAQLVSLISDTSANVAIVPVVSSAVESGHVLKASAGNLYRIRVTTGGTAGYVGVSNATTVPADGAVTPQLCQAVAANSTVEIDHSVIPDRYSTGISAWFSSTGCFTKTASATAMIEGFVQ
jgi:hypothetical protein